MSCTPAVSYTHLNKIHAIMQANAAKKSKGKKSKFQQRYEELMRQQAAQQRAKRK